MAQASTIEWTEATWNPVTGCAQVSPGCAHCYAKVFAERWRGIPDHPYEQGFDLRLWPERLDVPLRWRRPRTIFVNSMSDLFHEAIPLAFVDQVFATMRQAHWHTFQILTKRQDRLAELAGHFEWPTNVWMGVTIENRRFISSRRAPDCSRRRPLHQCRAPTRAARRTRPPGNRLADCRGRIWRPSSSRRSRVGPRFARLMRS
jgi:protein gp37